MNTHVMRGSPATGGADRTLDHEILDWRWKGFPPTREPVTVDAVGDQGWNILDGDLLFPVMVLKETALQHNLQSMARFCEEHGVWLAPHGKTTMAPEIVRRQFEAGAWAVCAATVSQARVFRAFHAPRIILANEIVQPAAVRWIAEELERHHDVEILALVDSPDAVAAMDEAVEEARTTRKVPVLLEVGIMGGRAGCRTVEEAEAVARAVGRSAHLELRGVEGFEGILEEASMEATLQAVDAYLDLMVQVGVSLEAGGAFEGSSEVVVSAGGSAYFDRVVERLAEWDGTMPLRVVLRSGCYVTHDAGHYEHSSPFGGRAVGPYRLLPALEVWGTVLSVPEPGLAIVGFGKRDVSYDLGLPIPWAVSSPRERMRATAGSLEVGALNDQHAYVHVAAGERLQVGDVLGCGISHPCTAFDKWRLIPVVDDDYAVTGAIRTFF